MIDKNESASSKRPEAQPDNSRFSLSESKLKRIVSWALVAGTAVGTVRLFSFILYHAVWGNTSPETWPVVILQKHFAAMVGTPLSAMTSYCLVSLLKVTNGPIEFEAAGFKFRGASGPIVLWLFCFLAIGAVFHLLWGNV